ncbi:MATE family efflux transporter [Mediterranea massiliensis]|uniref:MATE family efflux transporter n=1 Tax=Mediterranea massiliensis TaxID=1841865 RepID=UPI0025A4BE3D|nr:MATE family efflux transporter [Mediterranea massiliensis]MDM8337423.1 MATE family efflux transporter [Mediterranea massiliensis]
MAKSVEMTEGRTLPQIFYFALPLLMGNLLQQTYSMVDAAIVGKFLGVNPLAAVGASTSVVFLILGFCNGCCGGFGIPVAQKFGARDYSTMRRFVAVSLRLAAVMSVSLAVITALLCAWILHLIRTPENIFDDAYAYLLVTFIGIPCTFYYNLLSSIIRALGDSKTPFWFLLFSTVLNILLDLFCILVLGWGVAGAAIATLIAQGVSAVLCYIYMMRHFDILRTTLSERRYDSKLAGTLLSIGVPMGLQFSITAIGSIMLQSANNALGTACVAAFSAAIRIKMFFMCPFESLGIAMATFAGQNYGAGKPKRIWQGVKSSVLMMMIYWVFTFCVLMPGARTLAMLFVDASEVEILNDAALFLHVAVCFFPILGLLCILRYTIQGAGFTSFAMFSGVSEMIARILVSLFAVPAWGYVAVCFGDPTAWLFADAFLIPAFVYVYNKVKKIRPAVVAAS